MHMLVLGGRSMTILVLRLARWLNMILALPHLFKLVFAVQRTMVSGRCRRGWGGPLIRYEGSHSLSFSLSLPLSQSPFLSVSLSLSHSLAFSPILSNSLLCSMYLSHPIHSLSRSSGRSHPDLSEAPPLLPIPGDGPV